MRRNRSTIFNVKVIHYPYNCEPLSKIGRLSLISIELNLFQELESVVHSVRRLNHDDWFVAVDLLIFHILMIPNNDASGSRQVSAKARVIWLCAWFRYWPGRGSLYVCQLLLSLL